MLLTREEMEMIRQKKAEAEDDSLNDRDLLEAQWTWAAIELEYMDKILDTAEAGIKAQKTNHNK